MLEMLRSEGVITAGMGLLVLGVREWKRVWLAREWRREREQELLTQMVVEVADVVGRGVVVRHDGTSGGWSVTCDGSTRKSNGQRRKTLRHSNPLVDQRKAPARRRRR